jgi:hypothetical protein
MPKLTLIAGAAGSALILTAFTMSAGAAPRAVAPAAPGIVVLVQDEENAEVQNELEPETDKGTPMDAPGGGAGGEKPAMAPAQTGSGESAEKALEGTVGDDGINAIQQESIPVGK